KRCGFALFVRFIESFCVHLPVYLFTCLLVCLRGYIFAFLFAASMCQCVNVSMHRCIHASRRCYVAVRLQEARLRHFTEEGIVCRRRSPNPARFFGRTEALWRATAPRSCSAMTERPFGPSPGGSRNGITTRFPIPGIACK